MGRLHRPVAQASGGQIGLFKATRSAEGEPWIVEPNRLIFEVWEPNDPTRGYHAHAAAITTAGVVSHWGDVGYRNSERLHEFDLENYTTAPVTTTTVFGGYDENGVIYRAAPQPVATAPGVRPGEHFASGDLTREAVLRFGNLESASDRLEVDGAVDRPFSTSRGFTYAGALILHLHWQQGVGYVSSDGRAAGFAHFSPNGEDWVAFNHDDQANGRVFLYGDRLLGLAGGNELHVAPLPTIEVVEPLTLAPGGNNLIATSLENRFAPASGLAMREVNFTAGLWRYTDDGMPLDVQPAAPQFPPNTLVYEATSSSPTATALGTWWLQRAGETMDLDVPVIMESLVANLSEQSVQLLTRLRTADRSSRFAAIRGHEVAATKDWVALDYRAVFPYDGEARAAAQFDLNKPAPGSRFLIAMPYLGVESNLPYPIAPGTSGPDESEVLPPFEATEDWTVALVAAWPENASLVGRQERTVLKLDGPRDGRAEIAVEYAGDRRLDRLLVSVYEGKTLVARNTHQIRLLREEAIEVVVSGDGTTLRSTARSGSVQVSERSTTYSTALAITSVGWGGAGMESAAIEPILLCVDPHAAASSAGQRDWMHSTLRQKAVAFARNAPGDYNGDGLVNAADYTVWRDRLGTSVAVGESADGNRDGEITEADFDVWQEAYGTVVPTLAEVLAAPRGDTHSAVVASTASTAREAYAPTGQPDPIGLGKRGSEVFASALIPNDQPTRDRESYLPPTRQPVQAFGESTQEASLLALRAIDDTRDAAFETLTGTAETASIEMIQDRDLDDDLSMRLIDGDAFTARSDTSI